MTQFLPSPGPSDRQISPQAVAERVPQRDLADLRIFWGPEICRLEYLLHLLETGRVKDESGSLIA
jgi:hypothetical protein